MIAPSGRDLRSLALAGAVLMRAALLGAVLTLAIAASAVGAFGKAASPVYRVDHVVDGDTIALRDGQRVRLVQIDAPEVFFGTECSGRASRETKRLLSPGSRVRLFTEPATERVDQYGRLLRYVVRIDGSVNVNIRLVAIGAAARTSTRVAGADTRTGSSF